MVRSPLIFFPLGDRKVTFTGFSVTTGCGGQWSSLHPRRTDVRLSTQFRDVPRLIEPTNYSGGLPGRLNNS